MNIDPDGILAGALEAVPTPLSIMHAVRDADGTVVDFEWDFVNAAGANEILVDRQELVGQRLLEKLPEHRNGLFDLYVGVVETGVPLVLDEAGYGDTWGTQAVVPRVYDIRSTKLGDGFVVWWDDVTDRVKSRVDIEAQVRTGEIAALTTANAPIGQALVARDGSFTQVNPAFCRISGHTEEELIGSTFQAITHPEDLDADVKQATALAEREITDYTMEKRYVRSSGESVWIRLHASGVWDGDEFVTYIAQIADINEEVLLRGRLEARNRDLLQFAYVASHDLQAPLRTVSAYADLLFMSLDESTLSEEQQDYIAEIRSANAHMRALTADLLDLSRAAYSGSPVEVVPVKRAIEQTLSSLGGDIASDITILVDIREDPEVRANMTHLVQIASNLIGNSIKYQHPDRACHINVTAWRAESVVHITFEDNGIGIPPGSEERAFEMFQRLQTAGTGTGIGLALVRTLVEKYGGTVSLTSDGHSGTKVALEFAA